MTSEEILEEILLEASSMGIRSEVLSLSSKLRERNSKLKLSDSVELAFSQLTQ